MDEDRNVIGRGITNSRSNYDTAARVAKPGGAASTAASPVPPGADAARRAERRARRLSSARWSAPSGSSSFSSSWTIWRRPAAARSRANASPSARRREGGARRGVQAAARGGARALRARRQAQVGLLPRHRRLALPLRIAEEVARDAGMPYDLLLNVYDKSIIEVENRPPAGDSSDKFRRALGRVLQTDMPVKSAAADIQKMIEDALAIELEETYMVGTGYGRVTLPFSKEHIRSEILCHGLGAHVMYPQHAHGARHRRPGHQGDPGRPQRDRRELPDERPLRGRLRPLSRLHRRRDEHGPARTGPDGDEVDQDRRASTRLAPCSPAPSCATGCRWARSARTSWPDCTAPSSCARCRSCRAPAASPTSSPSPAASPRTRPRCASCAS